ncbi:alcohol dehydrogenase [Streptomyces sp. CB02923]|uniref:alcohol dehydrogenase catalytic domain-containing protein n=1 Tax=Streptomyces sp. CB02923 TaxID=1718985 RepID=UPI00093A8B9E|nr:alcohol dehydrogenase catalytic domain-containing protein [Streptomyces sp. CB02923]OKI01464.1 alcohol dehydrogenase [Streptomyces sp. CB02923]
MRAAVIPYPGAPWELREVPIPRPGPGQVLVRVRACGLCHNDVWLSRGVFDFPAVSPAVIGHEAVGEIVETGPGADSRKPGDRVGVTWIQGTCGRCASCRRGAPLSGRAGMACERPALTGMTAPGGHAEYVVANAAGTVLIPDGIDDVQAAPMLCAGYTAWSALAAAAPAPSERLAVLGIGGLGHLALQFSRAGGFETVAVTRSPDKHDLARRLGADHVVGDGSGLRDLGGADVVLVTGTSYRAASDALQGLRVDGRLVLATIDPVDSFTIGPDVPLWARRQRVIGASHDGPQLLAEALQFVAAGKVAPVVETFPAERINEAVDRVEEGSARFRAVVTY